MPYHIRPIDPSDNLALSSLVRDTLTEFGAVGPGYASGDPEVDDMHSFYTGAPDRAYWVIEDTDTRTIVGGGGYSRLKGTNESEAICELQKLYFRPVLRGQGFGRKLIDLCFNQAAKTGYTEMYLETLPHMASAITLYEKLGFEHLSSHKGNTGHHERCPIRMSKILELKVTA